MSFLVIVLLEVLSHKTQEVWPPGSLVPPSSSKHDLLGHPMCKSCLHNMDIFCSRTNTYSVCTTWKDGQWKLWELRVANKRKKRAKAAVLKAASAQQALLVIPANDWGQVPSSMVVVPAELTLVAPANLPPSTLYPPQLSSPLPPHR